MLRTSHIAALALLVAMPLTGCVSLGSEAPPQLLTLTADAQRAVGSDAQAMPLDALVVEVPATDSIIDQTRIPVQIDDSAVAYVKDAVWADKPARLFRGLVAETIAARSGKVVLDRAEVGVSGGTVLDGELTRFGYDKAMGAVVVRFDATLRSIGQPIRKRRFEAKVPVYTVEARPVAAALNQASNAVAREVSEWISPAAK